MSLIINGIKATATVLRSVDFTTDSLFGIATSEMESELYGFFCRKWWTLFCKL